jgi:hypothetical protein
VWAIVGKLPVQQQRKREESRQVKQDQPGDRHGDARDRRQHHDRNGDDRHCRGHALTDERLR